MVLEGTGQLYGASEVDLGKFAGGKESAPPPIMSGASVVPFFSWESFLELVLTPPTVQPPSGKIFVPVALS